MAAEKFIRAKEGRFLYKAVHDGIMNKDGSVIYTIGYGTRSTKGATITYEDGVKEFHKYLIKHTFSKIDPELPTNKYVALSSATYRTGVIIKTCEQIKKYVYITIKDKEGNKIKKKSKGLVIRAEEEYNLCIRKIK